MDTVLLTVVFTAAATALAMWLYVICADAAERCRRERQAEREVRRQKEDERLQRVHSRKLASSGAR